MKMKKHPFAIPTVCKMQNRIDPTPDYQRPPAWSRKQKQLLMDTILRNYDIPKFYWRKVNRADGVQYEVVDGQQRLRAIWEFEADEFPLPRVRTHCSEPEDDGCGESDGGEEGSGARSEGRRVGKECVSTGRTRGS